MNKLRSNGPLVLALLAFSVAPAAWTQAAPVLEPAAAYAAAATPMADALVARIETLARAGDGPGLARLVHEVLADAGLDEPARERVLYDAALACARVPSAGVHNALVALGARAPAVLVWHADGALRTAVPFRDVAAAARYALRRHGEEDARARTAAALARGEDPFVGVGPDPAHARRGLQLAFARAPQAQLAAVRDYVFAAAASGQHAGIALLVARRLGDADLARAALGHAHARDALALVRAARAAFAESAFDVLDAASRREDVASAALLEMGALLATEPRAQATLFALLADDARAGSAAAALGAAHDAGIARALADWVVARRDERIASRGVLALRLDGSDAARDALTRLASDARLPAALRAEAGA
jgi:hypothetical protein